MRERHTLLLPVILRWAVLTLAGWLAYALLCALWTIIYLGAPLYDWQWYLPVIALLVGLPIYLAGRLPRTRLAVLALVGLLVWTGIGYSGFGQVVYLQPGHAAPVPISFWSYSDFYSMPESVMHDLQAAGGRIYLDAGKDPFGGEHGRTLTTGLRRLAQYNIEVYLMPAASNFLSVPVNREWIANAHSLAADIQREGLSNVHGLIGDAEPPLNMPMDLLGNEQADFYQAVFGLRDLIATVHREYPGLQVGVTATSAHYLDGFDGDADLSVVIRSPVDPPGGWDYINVMTYSSYFPPGWRAYYVYVVERAMARRYPTDQVSHLIGLVGGGFPWEPLLDFDDLVRDARLSRALGVREIVVFQVDGALHVFGDDFVRRLTAAVNGPQSDSTVAVPFARPVSALFYGLAAADALLDARSWRGLLWLAWAILSGAIVAGLSSKPE